MTETRLIVSPLLQSIPLGCAYWHTPRIKCALTATVELIRNGKVLYACPTHLWALARVVGRD